MELKQLIKSRAHRILHRLDGYHPVSEISSIPVSAWNEIPRAVDEELIGYYINLGEEYKEVIVVTTRSLYILANDKWHPIAYTDIQSVEPQAVEEKHNVNSLQLYIKTGGVVVIPVTGGRGRFRDVWQFLRFLSRVVKAVQSISEDTE